MKLSITHLYHVESVNRQEQVIEERPRLLPSEVNRAVTDLIAAHPSNPVLVWELTGSTYMKFRYVINNDQS